jgi:transposase
MLSLYDSPKILNLSVSTVIRIFDLLSYAPWDLSEVVAIDEVKGNTNGEKYQCILTVPVSHRVIDILPNRFKPHLSSYFLSFNTCKTIFL